MTAVGESAWRIIGISLAEGFVSKILRHVLLSVMHTGGIDKTLWAAIG